MVTVEQEVRTPTIMPIIGSRRLPPHSASVISLYYYFRSDPGHFIRAKKPRTYHPSSSRAQRNFPLAVCVAGIFWLGVFLEHRAKLRHLAAAPVRRSKPTSLAPGLVAKPKYREPFQFRYRIFRVNRGYSRIPSGCGCPGTRAQIFLPARFGRYLRLRLISRPRAGRPLSCGFTFESAFAPDCADFSTFRGSADVVIRIIAPAAIANRIIFIFIPQPRTICRPGQVRYSTYCHVVI